MSGREDERAHARDVGERSEAESRAARLPPVGTPAKVYTAGEKAAALREYRRRGHRRLATRTYAARCNTCVWGCEMPTEILIDQWNHDRRSYRRETHCYGPLSSPPYRAGPTRKVPGRKKGMVYEEEDWVDQDATGHRAPDE